MQKRMVFLLLKTIACILSHFTVNYNGVILKKFNSILKFYFAWMNPFETKLKLNYMFVF
jgi:hypothetical protein